MCDGCNGSTWIGDDRARAGAESAEPSVLSGGRVRGDFARDVVIFPGDESTPRVGAWPIRLLSRIQHSLPPKSSACSNPARAP